MQNYADNANGQLNENANTDIATATARRKEVISHINEKRNNIDLAADKTKAENRLKPIIVRDVPGADEAAKYNALKDYLRDTTKGNETSFTDAQTWQD